MFSQRRFPLAPGASGFASEMLCGGAVLMAEIARRIGLGFLYERPSWARLAPARATPQATDERKRQQPA